MIYLYVTLILIHIFISGFFKGLSDRVENKTLYDKSKYFPKTNTDKFHTSRDFYSKAESSGRKWKNGSNSDDGERFLFSSTFLVSFTDFWHLSNNISKLNWIIAMIIGINFVHLSPIWWWMIIEFLILMSVWSLGFTTSYNWIFENKNKNK